jgi:hypothetical protein
MKRAATMLSAALAGWIVLGLFALLWTPAHAADAVLEATDRVGATIGLHEDAGLCVMGAKRAEFRSPGGGVKLSGCWRVDRDGDVWIALLNGQALILPFSAFKPPTKT